MKAKNTIIFLIPFILIVILLIFFVLSNEKNKNSTDINDDKIHSQVLYLDESILKISNDLNNIYLEEEKYGVKVDENVWNNIDEEVLILYSNWDNIILELNNSNINNINLINFGKILDNLAISIDNRDRVSGTANIVDLYYLLVSYSYGIDEETKNLIETKYYLLKASSLTDTSNWNLVSDSVKKAEESYYKNIGLINSNYYNQTTQNSIYVAIKELENTISLKNKELFLKKYKIILEKINNTIKV